MGSLGNSLMEFEEEENMTQDSCQDNVVSRLFDWDLDQLLRWAVFQQNSMHKMSNNLIFRQIFTSLDPSSLRASRQVMYRIFDPLNKTILGLPTMASFRLQTYGQQTYTYKPPEVNCFVGDVLYPEVVRKMIKTTLPWAKTKKWDRLKELPQLLSVGDFGRIQPHWCTIWRYVFKLMFIPKFLFFYTQVEDNHHR